MRKLFVAAMALGLFAGSTAFASRSMNSEKPNFNCSSAANTNLTEGNQQKIQRQVAFLTGSASKPGDERNQGPSGSGAR